MKTKIRNIDSFKYCCVWEVTERSKMGLIKKTKDTKLHLRQEDGIKLEGDRKGKYVISNFSTEVTRNLVFEIDLVTLDHFT